MFYRFLSKSEQISDSSSKVLTMLVSSFLSDVSSYLVPYSRPVVLQVFQQTLGSIAGADSLSALWDRTTSSVKKSAKKLLKWPKYQYYSDRLLQILIIFEKENCFPPNCVLSKMIFNVSNLIVFK